MTLYFSRLTLKRDPGLAALKGLIDPGDSNERTDAHHRLLWSVFSDGPERTRDYLWRSESNGRFYTLSKRPPKANGLFEAPECKTFSPTLAIGDRLRFLLRANAVRSIAVENGTGGESKRQRGKKVDVAMHLLYSVPAGHTSGSNTSTRSEARYDLARKASLEWLENQGKTHGFTVGTDSFVLEDYSTVVLPANRSKKTGQPRFGVFDMKGEIEVLDPESFIQQLATGFGRAKAFGQGLMLIRRA